MNFSEVKQLLDAGFTADEIRQMNAPAAAEPVPETDGTQDEPEEQPAAAPETQPAAAPELDEKLSGLNNTINQLIKTIQASNLQNNFRDSTPEVELEKQVDDIMKSIIRPEEGGKTV